ncbi:MAG: SDR family NAD(P)-dependent oxidoreductase, partial [Ectothiorhodospiraceae bacterium]|nr:SDR family NAD(P)-dependent oxidoreductase [Ectothiorhodospiraceae bacterium]
MDSKTTTVKKILEKVKSREISAEEGHRLIQESERNKLGSADATLVYSSPEWRASSCQPVSQAVSTPVADILVFDATGELYAELQQAWAQRKQSAVRWVRVSPGKAYSVDGDHYCLPMEYAEDYTRLLDELKNQGFRLGLIIHAWSEGMYSPEMLGEHLERSVGSVYQLSRALLQHKPPQPVEVQYVYRNHEGIASPVYAGISGFARTMRLEAPHYRYKVIELGQGSTEVAAQLLSEWGQQDEVQIRYSADGRAIRKLIEQPPAPAGSAPWRTEGIYLITGGLGGIGQQLAAHLLSHYKARLVLTGRSELDEAQHARLDQLRSLGGDVLYLRADVGEREEVERLVASIKTRHGALHGIVHAAGVLRDSFLLKKSKEELQAVLKPKVWGTVWLDEATRNEALELFVLFSSGAAIMGNVGQADYAYANSFQDHYAQWRAAQGRPGKSLSVNWPLWEEGGMEISAGARAHMWNELGILPLRTSSALKALEDGLRLETAQFMPLEGDREKILATLWGAETAPAQSRVRADKTHADKTVDVDETFRSRVEAYLKEMLSQEIKLPAERIEAHESFENYGIDSVVIVNLNRELENRFGELPKTLFFEYPNLHKLAAYFIDHLGTELRHKFGSTEPEPSVRTLPAHPLPENATVNVRRTRFRADAAALPDSGPDIEVKDVAIIGLGGRYPKARDLTAFWQNLQAGRDCIEEIPATRWNYRDYFDPERGLAGRSYSKWGGFIDDVDKFDPLFFNIAPRDAEWIDPQERLFLQTVWQTVEDAGYTREGLGNSKVGVFVGVMYGEYQLFSVDQDDSPVLGASYASIANRVSYFFDFHGPSMAVDSMCSSSLTSLHLACESIRHGECEYAVAGGVNLLLHPLKYLQLSRGRFVSSDGRCRAFGEGGDGYVPGEGVGAVLLKSLSQAVADGDSIQGVIRATAVNHGGKTNGYTVPNPNAQAEVVSEALQRSGIEAGSISYVEAHGTGTALGDPIEIGGLSKAYGGWQKQSCAIGSVKSNIGHLESAAGMAGLTKVLLQMKHRTLVPSLHAEQENSNIRFQDTPFHVQREVTEWQRPKRGVAGEAGDYPRRAGISSFGAGGSNAHVIIEEYEGPRCEAVSGGEQLVLLSARS